MLAGRTHYNIMVCIMDYYMATPERGLVLKPHGDWDGISKNRFPLCKMPRHKEKHNRECDVPE